MMQAWSQDTIRFMVDASRNSDYFEKLADVITPLLKGAMTICDAGCGLGQLSEVLGKRGFTVYACDKSKKAYEFVSNQNYNNVIPVNCDLLSWQPENQFDVMIFNYFGSMDTIVDIGSKCCKGHCIVIKKNYKTHRFSFSENPIIGHMNISAEQFLEEKGLAYTKQELEFEFGQPFKNLEDAFLFFKTYSRDTDKSLINKENILSRLVKSNISDFEYYLPQTKKSLLLSFNLNK